MFGLDITLNTFLLILIIEPKHLTKLSFINISIEMTHAIKRTK